MNENQNKEEYVIILDFLKNGYITDNRPLHLKTPVAQGIGKKTLALFELAPKKDIFLQPGQEVYIGEGKREEIHHIVGKIPFNKLTNNSKEEIEYTIKELVEKEEKRFVDFFNNAQPMTMRMHQLELLPGLGKKHMWEILDERVDPFKSYEDIKSRVKLIPNPQKLVIKRIIKEMEGTEKHRLFVKE